MPEWDDRDTGRCDLYRAFDKDGTLLYVGISLSALTRLEQHRQQSGWYGELTRLEIRRGLTASEARREERATIRQECPVWNIYHTGRRTGVRRRPAKARSCVALDPEQYYTHEELRALPGGRHLNLGKAVWNLPYRVRPDRHVEVQGRVIIAWVLRDRTAEEGLSAS